MNKFLLKSSDQEELFKKNLNEQWTFFQQAHQIFLRSTAITQKKQRKINNKSLRLLLAQWFCANDKEQKISWRIFLCEFLWSCNNLIFSIRTKKQNWKFSKIFKNSWNLMKKFIEWSSFTEIGTIAFQIDFANILGRFSIVESPAPNILFWKCQNPLQVLKIWYVKLNVQSPKKKNRNEHEKD